MVPKRSFLAGWRGSILQTLVFGVLAATLTSMIPAGVMAASNACRAVAVGLTHVEQGRHMRAADAFKTAVNAGHPLAEFQLGTLYYHGRGSFQDHGKAVKFWKRAAIDRFGPAAYLTARAYAHGIGVPKKPDTARFWLAAADVLVTDDSPFRERVDRAVRAMHDRLGDKKAAKLRNKAVEWLRERKPSFPECEQTLISKRPTDLLPEPDDGGMRVAGKGDGDGKKISKVTACKATVAGVRAYQREQFEKAAKLLKAALPLGHPFAYYYLARMLHEGHGVSARPENAVRLYQKAAAAGYAWAAYRLYNSYFKGDGVQKSVKRGIHWVIIADILAKDGGKLDQNVGKLREKVRAELGNQRFSSFIKEAKQWLNANRTEPPECGGVQVAKKAGSSKPEGRSKKRVDGGSGKLRPFSTGTGFYVSKDGHVLTNSHVIEKCDAAVVRPLGANPRPADIITFTPENVRQRTGKPDLGLVKVKGDPRGRVARFRTHEPVELGMDVHVFGFPLTSRYGKGGRYSEGTVSQATFAENSNWFEMSASISKGNSGGPVVDKNGFIIGVAVAGANQDYIKKKYGVELENSLFAVKGDMAEDFLRQHNVDFLGSRQADKETRNPVKILRDVAAQVICLVKR